MTIDEAYKTCFCEPYIVPIEKHKEARAVIDKALEEVQQYREIGTVDECMAAVEKINYYQNLLWKKVWWIDGLGNKVESTIICFYIEDGIEGVRCELRHCTTDAAEIGKSIHVINNDLEDVNIYEMEKLFC